MIKNLFGIFFNNPELEFIEDTFTECIIKVSHKKVLLPDSDTVQQKISKFPKSDKLLLTLYKDDISYGTYNMVGKNSSSDFFYNLEEFHNNPDGDIQIKLAISKNFSSNNEISIFNLNLFLKFLSEMKIEEELFEFQNLLKGNDVVNFLIYNEVKEMKFGTKTFRFYTPEAKFELDKIDRDEIREKRNLINNYVNSEKFDFVPEDFKWEIEPIDTTFKKVFNELTILFSIIYLSDYSRFESNQVDIHLVGYKTIKNKLSNFNFKDELMQYFTIYQWVYSSDNINDKIGIARNLISIHLLDDDFISLTKGTYSSIIANHRFYLKENTKNFIDLRNRIAESLQSFHSKSSSVIESFTDNFKKNMFGFITFYITVLIMTVITGGELKNIFTKDITYISLAIIALSIIVMVYSLIDYNRKKSRFKEQFLKNIDSYKYLLSQDELKEMFNSTEISKEEFTDFDKEKTILFSVWILLVIVFVILTLALGTFS